MNMKKPLLFPLFRTQFVERIFQQLVIIPILMLGVISQSFAQTPGCVPAGLQYWLKADDGTVPSAPGNLTNWTDKSGLSRTLNYVNSDPRLVSNVVNFNPTVNFDGDDYFRTDVGLGSTNNFTSTFTAGEVFSMVRAKNNNTSLGGPFDFGGASDAYYPLSNGFLYQDFGTSVRKAWNPITKVVVEGGGTTSGSAIDLTNFNLFNMYSATNDWQAAFNGTTEYSTTSNTVNFSTNLGGNHIGAITGAIFNGDISEIVLYNRKLTTQERQRVNTYLGVKYGTSLGHNYLAGDNTVIWDRVANSTHTNNTFGIGRDDCQGLSQKQSMSGNNGFQPIISTTGFATTNATNSAGFTVDKSFEMSGSDAGATNFATPFVFGSMTHRITRVWKIQETGTVGSVKVAILKSFTSDLTSVTLLRSNGNATFDGTDTQVVMNVETIGGVDYYTATIDFADGDYYTFGGNIPDNDNDGIADSLDLDDDNDGVLDSVENQCPPFAKWTDWTAVTAGSSATGTLPLTAGNVTVTYTSPQVQTIQTPGYFNLGDAYNGVMPVSGVEGLQAFHGVGLTHTYTFSQPVKDPILVFWSMNNSSFTFANDFILLGQKGGVTKSGNTLVGPFAESNGTIQLIGTYSSISYTSSTLENWTGVTVGSTDCPNADTDNDGIVNRFDLDSDGDGCSDAYEAGATSDKTANFKFTGAVGTNGLADAVETVADNGILNYISGYASWANNNIKDRCNLKSPGCVSIGLQYWYDASQAVTGTTSVTAWADRNNDLSLTKAASGTTATISLSPGDAQSNFNPYVLFPANAHITGVVDPTALGRLHTTFLVAQKDANIDPTYNHAFRFGSGAGGAVLHDFALGTALNGANHNPVHHWLSKGGTVNRWNTTANITFGTIGLYGGRINAITGTNNKEVSWNGNTTIYSDNITGDLSANMQIGGSTYGMQGRVPEVAYYNSVLTDNERNRVDTYFGIKYGLTLDHDYLSGSSVKIWDKTANSAYHNGVFGIGRDDCQGLNQKQSKSTNAGSIVTIGNNNVIVATNAANTNNFTADKSFEIIGDNGLAASYGVAYAISSYTPAGGYFRMNRVWKVQETGTVGSVSINNSAGGKHLLVSTDPTFATGVTEIPLVSGSVNYDFTDGQYFTFGSEIFSPGCVSGLDFWFDPAKNVTKTGTVVTGWADTDPSGNNPALTQATTTLQPSFSDGDALSNYNPYINFTGNQRLNTTVTGSNYAINTTTFGVVNKYAAKGSYNNFIRFTDTDNSDAGLHNWGLGTSDIAEDKVSLHYISAPFAGVAPGNVYNRLNGTKLFTLNTPTIMSASLNSTTGATSVGNNGNEVSATGKSGGGTFVPYNFLTVGGGNSFGMNNNKTQEIIHFSRELTIQERQRVQTYLAIKYGITLDVADNSALITEGDYIAGNGTTKIWDKTANSAFHNNVFGIGRDDCQALNQKQSKSVNTGSLMTIGIDNQINTTNSTNTGAFDTNASFLLAGDNNGAVTLTTLSPAAPCKPEGTDKATQRIWQFVETGSVEMTRVSTNLTAFGFGPTSTVFMQIASDAAFTNIVANVPANYNGTSGEFESGYNFTGTQYVRYVGSTNPPANLCTGGDKTLNWLSFTPSFDWWSWGTSDKTYNLGGGQSATVTVRSGATSINNAAPILYQPTLDWYPVSYYNYLYIPRYDNTPTTVVTTKIALHNTGAVSTAQPASKVSFKIKDIDGWWWGKDVVKVYGKLGGAVVNPILSTNKLYTNVTISGNTGTGSIYPWDWTVLGDMYVNFESPIDEIFVEHTKEDALYPGIDKFNDIAIGAIDITCKEVVPEVVTPDNVYLFKTVSPNSSRQGETFTYKFKFQNFNCNPQTVNLNDVLPTGITWKDSTLATTLAIGSQNSYGSTKTLTLGNISLPTGTSYIYVEAVASQTGTLNNQASFTVNGNTYQSDEPNIAGATNPTPITITAPPATANLTLTKAVDKAAMPQGGTVEYTYTIKNNGIAATTTQLTDILQGNAKYVTSTLTYLPTPSGTPLTNAYAGTGTFDIRDLTINGGQTLIIKIKAITVSNPVVGDTLKNTFTVRTGIGADAQNYTYKEFKSNQVITKIQSFVINNAQSQSVAAGSNKSGDAAIDLAPQGGTGPYTYSNGATDPKCVAPAGASPLPGSSNLVVNSNGNYTYTAPTTPGIYYYCIKVCDSGLPPLCDVAVYTITVSGTVATGTIDCSKTQMIPAPVAGTASNHALYVTVNVTTTGAFSPVTVTGSGFTLSLSPYSVTATATGLQTFIIPVHYDGTALTNSLQFTVGSAGSCTADMTKAPKVVSKNVYSLDGCTAIIPGVLTK